MSAICFALALRFHKGEPGPGPSGKEDLVPGNPRVRTGDLGTVSGSRTSTSGSAERFDVAHRPEHVEGLSVEASVESSSVRGLIRTESFSIC